MEEEKKENGIKPNSPTLNKKSHKLNGHKEVKEEVSTNGK